VADTPNSTYGNFTLSNGKDSIFVYGIKDMQGKDFSAMTEKFEKGDEVVIYGRLKRYVNNSTGEDKLEIVDGVLIKRTKASDIPEEPTQPDKPETPSVPETPSDKITSIADALSIGQKLERGFETTEVYNITGKVSQIVNTTYGNMYIEDGSGNTLYIYGIVNENGIRFDSLELDLAVGDTITVKSRILRYYNSKTGEDVVELKNAVITKIDKGGAELGTLSIKDALAKGQSLAPGQTTTEKYNLVGTVATQPNVTYGNFDLTDGNGNTIYVYGLYDSTGKRYDAMSIKLNVGDKVMINGPIMHYVNANSGAVKIEIKDATFIEKIK
jgi:hypothetical protein